MFRVYGTYSELLPKLRTMTKWPTESPVWTSECIELLKGGSTYPESNQTLENLIEKSGKFNIAFPIQTTRAQNLLAVVPKEVLERNMKTAYPILHEVALKLYAEFIRFKRINGNEVERRLYKDMTVLGLVRRLLKNRAVSFMNSYDEYLLLDGRLGIDDWEENVAGEAYLGYFLNDGSRRNNGKVESNRACLEPEGVVIGLIGTRLERKNAMEYQELIISPQQNTLENGYGPSPNTPSLKALFSTFYNHSFLTYDQVLKQSNSKFVKLDKGLYFDNEAYAKRMSLSFDTLILEANYRAKERNKFAYIHVVGLGLGVWKISNHQTQVFADTFIERLRYFGKQLSNISDVHFAYISGLENCAGYKHGDQFPIDSHPKNGIRIHISKREPFTKLQDDGNDDKLLVVSYAWDGNALPGNEFWQGMLDTTGDSSTCASSQIAEIQNAHINEAIDAGNLKVATLHDSVMTYKEYVQKLIE